MNILVMSQKLFCRQKQNYDLTIHKKERINVLYLVLILVRLFGFQIFPNKSKLHK